MPATSHSRFLDLRTLAALEQMRFTTRHRIEGAYTGRHASRQLGGSGEFVDYREYSPGEDLRRLDWKVFARTGKAYVRLFQDETNLLCTLVLDGSGSMDFGARSETDLTGSKLEYAQYLSTALSHVISRSLDQVGLAILKDSLDEAIPPGVTSSHVARIQERIEAIKSAPTTRMADGLRRLFEQGRQRGVLMFMSDFLMEDLEDVFAALRLFRHRQSEVIILHLVHPDEERLPDGSAFCFRGMENEGEINCSPTEIRNLYQERFRKHLDTVRTFSLSNGCDYRRVSTAVPYVTTLSGFLVDRNG
jgi:uncharacterized protein (DUF58 family)